LARSTSARGRFSTSPRSGAEQLQKISLEAVKHISNIKICFTTFYTDLMQKEAQPPAGLLLFWQEFRYSLGDYL
jgi:hypothetical protein